MSERIKDCWDRRRNTLLWIGMVGPAVVWLVYLEVAYLLVHFASKSGSQMALHASSLLFLLVSITLGLVTWRQLPKSSAPSGDMTGPVINRMRLMITVGLMASIEFTLLIAGSWLAMFLLKPGQP
jgi:hypothetical protein